MKPQLIALFMYMVFCPLLSMGQNATPVKRSECRPAELLPLNIDSMIADQRREMADSNISRAFSTLIEEKIVLLRKASKNKKLFFPFKDVDSAVYITYETKNSNNKNPGAPTLIVILCRQQIDALLKLVNNPGNFAYGECGTPEPEARVKFYRKGKTVATITFACAHGQLSFEPGLKLANFGALNQKGSALLDEIAPWQ